MDCEKTRFRILVVTRLWLGRFHSKKMLDRPIYQEKTDISAANEVLDFLFMTNSEQQTVRCGLPVIRKQSIAFDKGDFSVVSLICHSEEMNRIVWRVS